MALDTRKLIEAGYSQDRNGIWTLGTMVGNDNLITDAYDGGAIISPSGS